MLCSYAPMQVNYRKGDGSRRLGKYGHLVKLVAILSVCLLIAHGGESQQSINCAFKQSLHADSDRAKSITKASVGVNSKKYTAPVVTDVGFQ